MYSLCSYQISSIEPLFFPLNSCIFNLDALMNTAVKPKTTHTHEIGIDGECPICTKLRDPETGNLPYNAKVIAAMEESRAAMRGEIPAKWHQPHELEDVLKEMLED